MRINFTIFRVLLGAGQVQYKGKEGREEVRKGGRKGRRKQGREERSEGGREERVAVKLDLTSCLQIIHKVANLSLDNQDLSIPYPDEAASSFRAFASTVPSTRNAFPHIICMANSVASFKPLFKHQLLSEAVLDHIHSMAARFLFLSWLKFSPYYSFHQHAINFRHLLVFLFH